jgi:uncharacterized protein (DUF1499 family)
MADTSATRARSAALSAFLATLGLVAMAVGVAASTLGLVPPLVGFRGFGLGLLLCLLALVTGVVALRATRRAPGRASAWRGTLGGLLGLGIVLAAAAPGLGVPPINDITTDPADPPAFAKAAEAEPNRGRDMDYPGEAFATQQRAAYPSLAPIELPVPPAEALARAERAARQLGWEVVAVQPEAGTLEARQTSRLFRFVDDVVVRVRPSGAGSRVDVRSRSRDGRGDLGANAARIQAFREAL